MDVAAPITSRGSRVAIAAAVVLIALGATKLAGAVSVFGRHIPQPDLDGDYLAGIAAAVLLGASILIWPIDPRDRPRLLTLWVAKCVITLGLMLFYEWNYSLDAYAYFGFATFWGDPAAPPRLTFGAGSDNVTYIASVVGGIVPSYHAIKVVFAMIGLIAIYIFYRAAVRLRRREDARILYVLGLYPSIIFWSSIVGKDPLQLLGIAIYAYGVVSWVRRQGPGPLLLIGTGIAITASVRLWGGPILLIPLTAIFWSRRMPALVRVGFGLVVAGILVLAWRQFSDQYRIETIEDLRTVAEGVSSGWASGGSSVQNNVQFDDAGAVLRYLPVGIFTALFRPLPGEVLNPFGLLSGLENLVLVGLTGLALFNWRSAPRSDPVFRWAVLLVMGWAVVYAFIAYNLGSIVRFKLQVYPVILLILLYLASVRKRRSAATSAPERPASAD